MEKKQHVFEITPCPASSSTLFIKHIKNSKQVNQSIVNLNNCTAHLLLTEH